MRKPLYGAEPEVTTCDICGDRLVIPPGVTYRGDKMHRHCAIWHEKVDITIDEVEPYLDQVEQDIQDLFSNMGPMSDG